MNYQELQEAKQTFRLALWTMKENSTRRLRTPKTRPKTRKKEGCPDKG